MNVNSTSSYVSSASSNKGFSGIASGLDTESMVESMLSGTQAKIDKQLGLKQQIEWKQEIYRDIISQLNVFQNQFFNSSSSTNLLSDTFFNAMNAVSASSAFKVAATSSAVAGSTNLEVRQLATSTSITSGAGVSGKLVGSLDNVALEQMIQDQLGDDAAYTVKFQVGSKTVEANLRDVFVNGNTFKSYGSIADRDAEIQTKLEEAFADTGVDVSVKDGAVTLSSAGDSIVVSGDSGEIGLQRLGLTAGSRSKSEKKDEPSTLTSKVDDVPKFSFSVTLDDLKKDITIDLRNVLTDGKIDTGKLIGEFQTQLNKAHGTNQVQVVQDGNNFELKVSAGRKVMIGGDKDVLDAMGVKNGQSNRIGMGGALKDLYFANGLQGSTFRFTINGVEFSFTGENTMSDVVNEINRSNAGVRLVYRAQSDTFTLEMSESGAGRDIDMEDQEGNLLDSLFGDNAVKTMGQNAVIKIDGVLTERSSNTFSVNGLNITLKEPTGDYVRGQRVGINNDGAVEFPPEGTYIDNDGDVYDAVTGKPVLDSSGKQLHFPSWEFRGIDGEKVTGAAGVDTEGFLLDSEGNRIFSGTSEKIEVFRNTDQVIEGVKQFVDAYNKIVKTLNDYLSEETTYTEYAPLTDAQKKEMSEKEIELWEEKAKQGLLHRDATIDSFLQSMRTALYERPDGCSLAIYDLGIETGDWESKGQLVFSTDGEARLRQMIESDPASVMQLFTDSEEGLAVKLNTILDRTAKISSGSPGALVELAGVKGKSSEKDNSLYVRLKAIDERIAALKRTYEKEKTRYWNQFNSMEQMIANMNSQSSWLTQQLG